MAKNYLTYPFKTMRITQSYTGSTSHKPHTTGYPKDYPLDEGGKDGGRDAFYCPCDELKIVRIYGVGNGGTNTIWVESTSPVYFADGTSNYTCGQITHPNDSDIRDLRVGQKFKRGQVICYEGTDGATGNHIHFSFGKGKYKGSGWTRNSKGKYVLTTTSGAYKPDQLFYVDKSFTKVANSKGLIFKDMPKNTVAKEEPKKTTSTTTSTKKDNFLPSRGYFQKGDTSKNVGKIATFMYENFPAYTSKKALGNFYGDNLIAAVKEFQKRVGLEPDGYFGKLTLAELEKLGFKR